MTHTTKPERPAADGSPGDRYPGMQVSSEGAQARQWPDDGALRDLMEQLNRAADPNWKPAAPARPARAERAEWNRAQHAAQQQRQNEEAAVARAARRAANRAAHRDRKHTK